MHQTQAGAGKFPQTIINAKLISQATLNIILLDGADARGTTPLNRGTGLALCERLQKELFRGFCRLKRDKIHDSSSFQASFARQAKLASHLHPG